MYKVFKYSTPCRDLSLGRGWLYRGAKNVIRKLFIENTLLSLIMTLSISLENEFFFFCSLPTWAPDSEARLAFPGSVVIQRTHLSSHV